MDLTDLRVEHEGTTFTIHVLRAGTRPRRGLEGGLLYVPLWAWARAQWHLSAGKAWAVEVHRLEPVRLKMEVGGTLISEERFPTKADAIARVEALLAEWGVVHG